MNPTSSNNELNLPGTGRVQGSFAKRLAGFAGLPFLSLLAPFLLLPLISRIGGVGGWAAIAIGQSVGAFAAVAITFGWTLVGPARVAAADDAARKLLYGDSVVSRLLLLVVVAPFAGILSFALSPHGYQFDSVAMTVAMAIGSLSPAWFLVGIGRPGQIAKYEVIPRMIAVGLAAILLLWSGAIVVYPLCLIAATLFGVVLFSVRVAHLHLRAGVNLRRVTRQMWRDRVGAMTVLAAGAYGATPVAILSMVAPVSAVATFSSADKLSKVALFSVQSLGNSFQGWVAEDRPLGITRRMQQSLIAHTVLGLAGLLGFVFLCVPLTSILFGSHVAATESTSLFYGIAFLAVSMNTSSGRHILIPLHHTKTVLLSTVAGAVFGILAMVYLGSRFSGEGGAAGLALGEVVVCLVQFAGVVGIARRKTALDP